MLSHLKIYIKGTEIRNLKHMWKCKSRLQIADRYFLCHPVLFHYRRQHNLVNILLLLFQLMVLSPMNWLLEKYVL